MTGHKTKAGKTALEGKKTLAHMLRLLKAGNDIQDLAARYSRPVGVITAYLHERGYDMYGHKMPPATIKERRPLVMSAGGSAHYVASSGPDGHGRGVPLTPVVHRPDREKPKPFDWGNGSDAAWSEAVTARRQRARRGRSDTRVDGRTLTGADRSQPRSGPPPRFTPEQDAEIRAKYEGGRTAKSLAREYEASDVTIARAIIRAGGRTYGRSGRWRWAS